MSISRRKLSCVVAAIIGLGLTASLAVAQTPLGTEFTYQGRLVLNDEPLNHMADFDFSLQDAAGSGAPPVSGSQLSSTHTVGIEKLSIPESAIELQVVAMSCVDLDGQSVTLASTIRKAKLRQSEADVFRLALD